MKDCSTWRPRSAINESAALGRAVTVQEVVDGSVAGYQADIDRHYGLVQGEPEGTTLARGDHGRVST